MRLFISYARIDREQVSNLVKILQRSGHDTWFDYQLTPGRNWKEQLLEWISECSAFVYAMTDASIESEWCRWELERAAEIKKPIIPIKMQRNLRLPQQLADIHYVDFSDGLTTEAFADLMRGLTNASPLAPSHIPPAPRDPKGVPAYVVEQNVSSMEGGTVIAQQINYYSTTPDAGNNLVGNIGISGTLSAKIIRNNVEFTQEQWTTLELIKDILPPPFEWRPIPEGFVNLKGAVHHNPPGTNGGRYKVPVFLIAKYPITNAQFKAFVDAPDGYREGNWWEFSSEAKIWRASNQLVPSSSLDTDYPRTNIRWYEAIAFCRWLEAKLNIEAQGSRITLPTEQQWQRAAQGDDNRSYPWGNMMDASRCNFQSPDNSATSVTKFPEGNSPFGVMDMSGNTWEWCLNEFYTDSTHLIGGNARAIRGGAYYTSLDRLNVTWRDGQVPDVIHEAFGFRICLASI